MRAPGARRTNQVKPNSIHFMNEYEIYLPTTLNDGTPIDGRQIQGIKDTLMKAFGGYTHLNHRSEGVWRMGGVTFRDEVTIVRVLDDGSAQFDLAAFKESLKHALQQEEVLIIRRNVEAL